MPRVVRQQSLVIHLTSGRMSGKVRNQIGFLRQTKDFHILFLPHIHDIELFARCFEQPGFRAFSNFVRQVRLRLDVTQCENSFQQNCQKNGESMQRVGGDAETTQAAPGMASGKYTTSDPKINSNGAPPVCCLICPTSRVSINFVYRR